MMSSLLVQCSVVLEDTDFALLPFGRPQEWLHGRTALALPSRQRGWQSLGPRQSKRPVDKSSGRAGAVRLEAVWPRLRWH